jgi:hypothetical protein
LHSCEIGKVDSRRERREKKRKKERREIRKKHGLPFGLYSMFCKQNLQSREEQRS